MVEELHLAQTAEAELVARVAALEVSLAGKEAEVEQAAGGRSCTAAGGVADAVAVPMAAGGGEGSGEGDRGSGAPDRLWC